jgi:hypothetical protein
MGVFKFVANKFEFWEQKKQGTEAVSDRGIEEALEVGHRK